MLGKNFDIGEEGLAWALARSPCPQLLQELVHLSRSHFGWFSKNPARAFEYPWVFTEIGKVVGKSVLDIGAGVSPLPLLLAQGGQRVVTVDDSTIIRKLGQGQEKWNGWGYFDYACLNGNVSSINVDILAASFANYSFDCIYSVSVVEHLPALARRKLWSKVKQWLSRDGVLLLTVDLFPGTEQLWNYNQDKIVESVEEHGDLVALEAELSQVGFSLERRKILCDLRDGRTDCALLRFVQIHKSTGHLKEKYITARSTMLAQCGVKRFEEKLTPSIERTLVPDAGRVVMGCVAENNSKYLSQALRLLQSVRWFGGDMASVNFYVCVVGNIEPGYVREFERLGAFVRVVTPFDGRHPPSNKLRLLELPEIKAYDTVMLLDCDTIVVQDPWPFLDGRTFQAKMADLPTVPHEVFQRLFQHFDIKMPGQDYQCNPSGVPTICYCNGGVLIFPHQTLSDIVSAWRHFNSALLERLDLLGTNTFYCEQASLSLAFAAQPVPFSELPLSMNFPLHLTRMDTPPAMHDCDPVILHYHDRVDDRGYMQTSPYPGAQKRIEQFNERLRQERRQHFNNRLFWDSRYIHDPELGSGLGSRGTARMQQRPAFIVGCMRSGTTLLATMLGGFDGIVNCPFELKRIWSESGCGPMASAGTRDLTCPQLGAEDVMEGQAERLALAFADEMAKNRMGKRDDAIFLNKNPHLCNKLPFVNALFPDARFIWIHRHLPQVVVSLRKLFEDVQRRQQTWHYWPKRQPDITARCWEAFHFNPPPDNVDPARCFPGGNVKYLAEYWLESNRAVETFFRTLPADRRLSVQEEHLIETPEIQLARCLAFLGLPLTSSLDISTKLDSTRNQLWISRLTPDEHAVLLEFVAAHAQAIDEVFPGENRAAHYRDQLESAYEVSEIRRIHLQKAFEAYGHGDTVTGCEELTYVLQNVSVLRSNPQALVDEIVNRTLLLATNHTFDDRDLIQLARMICDGLPESIDSKRVRRLALVTLHEALVFRCQRLGALREARSHALRAIALDRRLLLNRGLISVIIESFVGSSLMKRWRTWKKHRSTQAEDQRDA